MLHAELDEICRSCSTRSSTSSKTASGRSSKKVGEAHAAGGSGSVDGGCSTADEKLSNTPSCLLAHESSSQMKVGHCLRPRGISSQRQKERR